MGAVYTFANVEIRTGLSRSTLYRLIAAGAFPRPIKLGPRRVGFRADDLEKWLESREAA